MIFIEYPSAEAARARAQQEAGARADRRRRGSVPGSPFVVITNGSSAALLIADEDASLLATDELQRATHQPPPWVIKLLGAA